MILSMVSIIKNYIFYWGAHLSTVSKKKVNIICSIPKLKDIILVAEDFDGEYLHSAKKNKKGTI